MSKIQNVTIVGAVLLSFSTVLFAQTFDATTEEGSTGADVVDAVVRKIARSNIFKYDKNFLRRIAYVESKFGEDGHRYADGGIWRIDEFEYEQTKNSTLEEIYGKIATCIHPSILWMNTTWSDMLKPLYSGIAARLFLETSLSGLPVPGTINDQAKHWEAHFNCNLCKKSEQYIDQVTELETKPTCDALIDLCIVMDGSTSIKDENFDLAKKFLVELVMQFTIVKARIGLIVYSEFPIVVTIKVENDLEIEDMVDIISTYKYNGSTHTATGAAIMEGISELQKNDTRPGVPQLITVFSDSTPDIGVGMSVADAAQKAFEAEVTSFAIGIDSGTHEDNLNLIAHNITNNMFLTASYNELQSYSKLLNSRMCEIPQKPEFNVTINDSLQQNEKRYYKYKLRPDTKGIVLNTIETLGRVKGFYSYTEENPSSAIYDGVIVPNVETFIPSYSVPDVGTFIPSYSVVQGTDMNKNFMNVVYAVIQGLDDNNTYSVMAAFGDPPVFCREPWIHLPHEIHCNLYYNCTTRYPTLMKCPEQRVFYPDTYSCRVPSDFSCLHYLTTQTYSSTATSSQTQTSEATISQVDTTGTTTQGETYSSTASPTQAYMSTSTTGQVESTSTTAEADTGTTIVEVEIEVTSKLWPIIGITSGSIAVLIFLIIAGCCVKKLPANWWQKRQCNNSGNKKLFQMLGKNRAKMNDYGNPIIPDYPNSKKSEWEIDSCCLLQGEVIGKGAFGCVRKATLVLNGKQIVVAVKTQRDVTAIQHAFSEEFEILKGLGKHPHIVGLIGIVLKGESALVVEYCSGGNLQTYLRAHQMTGNEVATTVGTNEDAEKAENVKVLTEMDLVTYAKHIACAMEFLSTSKVVHRDLAARNVLVSIGAKSTVTLKLADFGMSRDVYEDDWYIKSSDDKIPFKWLALECVLNGVYSTKSDVWSFGVVLWEIVTLGGNPYPGIENTKIFAMLKDGYRMPQPDNCSDELYTMMNLCWREQPADRPDFTMLSRKLETMMEAVNDYFYIINPMSQATEIVGE